MQDKLKADSMVRLIGMTVIMMFMSCLIVGCDGSSGGDENVSPLQEGSFIDSPVQGLDYHSASHSGVTDEDGHFFYREGEMVTFSIGDVVLGQAMAREIMTPLDFIDESEMPFDETHPFATNMGRFLQSLDGDGDPENGIMISGDVRDEVNGRLIDFHQSIHDFEMDPHVSALFDSLNGLNIPHNGLMWGLEAVENAQQHMNEHLGDYMGRYMTGGDTMEPGTGMGDGGFMDGGTMSPGSGMDDFIGGDGMEPDSAGRGDYTNNGGDDMGDGDFMRNGNMGAHM